jgi:hypothetical protein
MYFIAFVLINMQPGAAWRLVRLSTQKENGCRWWTRRHKQNKKALFIPYKKAVPHLTLIHFTFAIPLKSHFN